MKNYVLLFNLLFFISFSSLNVQAGEGNYEPPTERELVELEVEGVYEYYSSESYLIRLTKKGGEVDWVLPMVIGGCEAKAVARSIHEVGFSRPLTYDLFNSIFEKSSIKLKHVTITKLEGGVFYAVLVLDDNGKTIEIDARPSDSMNIAMKTGVPIFATKEVLDAAKETIKEETDK